MLSQRGKAAFRPRGGRGGGALTWSLAAVAIVVIWGGLWWWVKYGTETEEFDPDRPRRFKVKPSEMGQGVYVHAKGVIRIVSGDVEIHLRPRPDSGLDMYAFALNDQTWLTPEQEELRKVGKKATAGGKFVETLRITPEQVNRARELRFEPTLVLTDEDRARIAEPFREWQQTSGEAHKEAEKVLLAVAKDIGDRSITLTKELLIKDIEQVPDLLTQEQWQKYADLKLSK